MASAANAAMAATLTSVADHRRSLFTIEIVVPMPSS